MSPSCDRCFPVPLRPPWSIDHELITEHSDRWMCNVSGYQKFQISLINGSYGFVGSTVFSRVDVCTGLVAIMSNSELKTKRSRKWSDIDWIVLWEDVSSVNLMFFSLDGIPPWASRLRPRPRSFRTRFCADSPKCFATMSRDQVSVSAISVRILTPVRSVSQPTALKLLQSTGGTSHKDCLKSAYTMSTLNECCTA
jgi:hypothetical protein